MMEWSTAVVKDIRNETANTKRFFLEIKDRTEFAFLSGQFISLDLPISDKKSKRLRSYSIASFPNRTNKIVLLISLHPIGIGTKYLFHEICVGSELIFRGPQGVFTLPSLINQPILFNCTGTGIAPFRSMLWSLLNNDHNQYPIHLVFGCRYKENLLYYDEMKSLKLQYPNFYYHVALSQSHDQEGFHKGHLHPIYEQIIATETDPLCYLCGWKNMIDQARSNLEKLGIDKKNIRFELYG